MAPAPAKVGAVYMCGHGAGASQAGAGDIAGPVAAQIAPPAQVAARCPAADRQVKPAVMRGPRAAAKRCQIARVLLLRAAAGRN